MKKIIILALILCLLFTFSCSSSFSKTEKNSLKSSVSKTSKIRLKDPKLIKIKKISSVDVNLYNKKLNEDKVKYKQIKSVLNQDQFNLYKVTEKLLRANNLQYQNWRVGIKNKTEDVNAYTTAANLIIINSALYDSIYNDETALAFVVSHEISHNILNHGQKSYEILYKIKDLEKQAKAMRRRKEAIYTLGDIAVDVQISNLCKKLRLMEYQADKEALTLMARAGFDMKEASNALKFLDRLPEINSNYDTHPSTADRISAVNKELDIININALNAQGQNNIYNSKVINVKKSSDKKTFILEAQKEFKHFSYVAEPQDLKLIERAYSQYKEKDFINAQTNFKEAYSINKTNYIPALYLSYIDEYNYYKLHDRKLIKKSYHWVKRAKKIKPNDKNVLKQYNDVKTIIKSKNK